MRGVARVIENPLGHGEFNLAARKELGRSLRANGYTRAFVLPNSWKSALVPWFAGIPRRTGYAGEGRWVLLNDVRRVNTRTMRRLVDRYAALAAPPGALVPTPPAPVLVPDLANRAAAIRGLRLKTDRPIAALCPGAEFGPAKRWPAEHFAALARQLIVNGYHVWLIGSPNDRAITGAVVSALGAMPEARALRDLAGRTDLGTAIDLLSSASVVVSNDSGLMHAAAAVGAPLIALFGSSSPAFTPPLSPIAKIARIDIPCSPCFKRECPLGHFRCMRDLKPDGVYDLARGSATPIATD
jgi:heptosyltransferase-2